MSQGISTKRILGKIAILVLLLCGGMMFMSYATDTFAVISRGFVVSAEDMLYHNGRAVTAAFYYLWGIAGGSLKGFYRVSFVAALLLLVAAVAALERMTRPVIADENLRVLTCVITLLNPFFVEYMMFIEKFAFALAILLDVLGAHWIARFCETRRWYYVLFTVAATIGVMLTYQPAIGLYGILAVPFAFYYAMHSVERQGQSRGIYVRYLSNLIIVAVTFVIALLGYIGIYNGLIHAMRENFESTGESLVSQMIHIAFQEIHSLRSTFEAYPRDLFVGLAAIVFVLAVIAILRSSHKLLHALNLACSILAVFVLSAAPVVGGGGYDMRVLYPLASLLGILVIDLHMTLHEAHASDGRVLRAMRAAQWLVLVVLFAMMFVGYHRIYRDKYLSNYLDQVRCLQIGERIAAYEAQSGNRITTVAFYSDGHGSKAQYPGLYSEGDLTTSSFRTDWSDKNALNYYLGTHYARGEQDPAYVEYFAAKNWDQMSDEQIVFDGDTLHYCVY